MNNLPKNVFPEDWVYSNGKTPEEEALHRLYFKKLIKRMLAHPELVPLGNTLEDVRLCLTNGSIDNPNYQNSAFEFETYFEFKDEMASKGIKVFNAEIEHAYSSKEVQEARAQKMREYLLNHQSLMSVLSDYGIDNNDMINPKFLKRSYYVFAKAWCFVTQQKLAGVELYLLDINSDDIKHFLNIFEPLVYCKKKGSFL